MNQGALLDLLLLSSFDPMQEAATISDRLGDPADEPGLDIVPVSDLIVHEACLHDLSGDLAGLLRAQLP